MNENIKVRGRVDVRLDGELVESEGNLVVTNGLYQLVKAAAGLSTDMPVAIAIGDGTTAPADGDTELENELARKAFSQSPTNPTFDSVEYKVLFNTNEANVSFTEVGLFSDSTSNGVMSARTVINEKTKTDTEEMEITWTITLSS